MKRIRFVLLVLPLFCFFLLTYSQTKDDVINSYNKGVELANTDTKVAIEKFNETLEMAIKVGEESNDIKNLIESQLPALQYKYAADLYKEQDITGAIPNFEKAGELATQYGDAKTREKCDDIIPKLYFSLGNSYYKEDNYDEALVNFDKSLELNPQYAKVYLSKGLVYKKLNDTESMIANMDKAIETGLASGDEGTANTSAKLVRDNLLFSGNLAVQSESWEEAVNLLNRANTYGDQLAQTNYLLALANNKLSKWDEAIAAANKGLELEENTSDAKAKFYYELGNAYVGKGEHDPACQAYKNAAFGNYTESANYQVNTVLQCN